MTYNKHLVVSKNEHCFSTIPNRTIKSNTRPLLRVLCFLIPHNSSAKKRGNKKYQISFCK